MTLACATGQYIRDNTCQNCTAGYYDYYGCSPCGAGKFCEQGQCNYFYPNYGCKNCPLGTYASSDTAASCISRSSGYITSVTGSSFSSSCYRVFSTGQYLSDSSCYSCPVVTYTNNNDHTLSPCNVCTSGSTSSSSCYQEYSSSSSPSPSPSTRTSCSYGEYYSGVSCYSCPKGTYSSFRDHQAGSCTPCSSGYTTSGTGSTSSSSCYQEYSSFGSSTSNIVVVAGSVAGAAVVLGVGMGFLMYKLTRRRSLRVH